MNKQDLIKQTKQIKHKYTEEQLKEAQELMILNNLAGKRISSWTFFDVLKVMEEKGLSGVPLLDAKTFIAWKEQGFKVKKGEKAFYKNISWIENEETGENYPKVYCLFHRSQVEEIEKKDKETI